MMSKSKNAWRGKKAGRNAHLTLGCLVTAMADGRLFVAPGHDHGQASRNSNVAQLVFLQLLTEYVPNQENAASTWQKALKPNSQAKKPRQTQKQNSNEEAEKWENYCSVTVFKRCMALEKELEKYF